MELWKCYLCDGNAPSQDQTIQHIKDLNMPKYPALNDKYFCILRSLICWMVWPWEGVLPSRRQHCQCSMATLPWADDSGQYLQTTKVNRSFYFFFFLFLHIIAIPKGSCQGENLLNHFPWKNQMRSTNAISNKKFVQYCASQRCSMVPFHNFKEFLIVIFFCTNYA